MRRANEGSTLLEVLIAMAILASAGTTMVTALTAALAGEHTAVGREHAVASADRVLKAATLLTSGELDRRLGRHPVGEFAVEVQRPEPKLYRIAVALAATPETEMLVTVVYRPEEATR